MTTTPNPCVCAQCGATFAGARPTSRLCSRRCRVNDHRARVRLVENPDGTTEYLYVMEDPGRPGLVKIGASKGPETRRRALACAAPGITVAASWAVPDMRAAEKAMHDLFRPDRSRHEWFKVTAGEVTFAHESLSNGAEAADVRAVIEAARSVRGGDAPAFTPPRSHVEDFPRATRPDMAGSVRRAMLGPGVEPYLPGARTPAAEWWSRNMHLLEPQG